MKNTEAVVAQLSATLAEAPARTARRQRIGSSATTDSAKLCPFIPCVFTDVRPAGPRPARPSVRSPRRRG